jgi:D-serine deaminase-like pyridoxal phosphate-dependent protein
MPHQLRAVYSWGVKRILLANEIADIRDARWLAKTLQADQGLEVWLEVDSLAGLQLLETAFASENVPSAVINRLHLLVEVGVTGGRTGVRTSEQAVTLARAIKQAGFQVSGVIGFEGPVAHDASANSLARVQTWLDGILNIADQVAEIANLQPGQTPFVVSVGGSAYIDLMLPALASIKAKGWQGVIRSGAYLTHDAIHYEELNPFSRIPGGQRLTPALTVWAQVLSVPEPGLAIVGAGKRDLAFDLDLPVPLWVRRPDELGHLGLNRTPPKNAHVSELNDQHTFLKFDPETATTSETALQVGDVIGFGISHPCTAFDKWRYLTIIQGDQVLDIYPLDF